MYVVILDQSFGAQASFTPPSQQRPPHHCHRHPRPRRHYPYHGFHEEGF